MTPARALLLAALLGALLWLLLFVSLTEKADVNVRAADPSQEHAMHTRLDEVSKHWVDLATAEFLRQYEAKRIEAERREVARQKAKRIEQNKRATVRAASTYQGNPAGQVNGYPCGGDLPPCKVLRCESGGNPTAQNPRSSASGLWQIVDGTWARFAGYARAFHAPPSVQNEKARLLWANGRGAFHWRSCL